MARLQCHWCGEYFAHTELKTAIRMRNVHATKDHRGFEIPAAVGMQPLEAFD